LRPEIIKNKNMETTVANTSLNAAQIFLLQSFSRIKSEQEKTEIQSLLLDYYRKRVDAYAENISLNDEQIEKILNSHYRTPYQ
jgi:hypothetical protein